MLHEVMPHCCWRYVNTAENPADVATRGATPHDLAYNRQWWSGPKWLLESASRWPSPTSMTETYTIDHKESTTAHSSCLATQVDTPDVMKGFFGLTRLTRTLVRCRRLFQRRRDLQAPRSVSPITVEEMRREFLQCVRWCQQQSYLAEIRELSRGNPVSKSSPLRTVCPFLDDGGILRVGGRLRDSNLPFDEQHRVLLDGRCNLAKLVIDWAHRKALHGGFRIIYAYAMRRSWIIRGRVRVKDYIRSCVTCSKATARTSTQVMAPLPEARITPSRPFDRCEVDYAGPFPILSSKGRGIRSYKGYVAVFVCLSTKTSHLELVGDLTTDSYLGVLTRFSSRRRRPTEIWSDNATNFKGAQNELKQMLREAELDWELVTDTLASEGIKWSFFPPSAPHFGGLWEAGVKSMKAHLRRVGDTRRLTFEEFTTLLASIEAVLNSRPLGDQFWLRWSREYLNTLQQRHKWARTRRDYQVNDVVLIVDPSLISGQGRWPIDRIVRVFPGSDHHVRVVEVRTALVVYTRSVTKLVRLPIQDSE